ncbi:glutaminase [Billgrantia diversa]|uniref:glutaminase n=1 Tax=Halomonas sp. MCCC 1A13316 TaxID=2733487 RepID=UPI003FA56903
MHTRAQTRLGQGRVASYIPALAQQDPERLGIAVYTNAGELYTAGDAGTPFSIQSIAKVLLLTLALRTMTICGMYDAAGDFA